MDTAPPTLPGIPTQHSSPESPSLRVWLTRLERGAPAPAETRPPSPTLTRENSRPSLTTHPSKPSSEASTLEPRPSTTHSTRSRSSTSIVRLSAA